MNRPNAKIAIVGGVGLGDTLIQMVLATNLRRNGHRVTVFSSLLQQLAGWFPHVVIQPTLTERSLETALAAFSTILAAGPPPVTLNADRMKARWIAYESEFLDRLSMVQNMTRFLRRTFAFTMLTPECGIQAPPSLSWRKHRQRVVVHPTSAEKGKNWPLANFLRLAEWLVDHGYEVVFIMHALELACWRPQIGDRFRTVGFSNLADCAAFLFESGYFIGNDSGGGHLAASLHVPTVSIHGRKGKARLWRPDWGMVEVAVPAVNLIGSRLRQSCWKALLPVGRVQRAFQRLVCRSCEMEKGRC